MDVFSLLTAGVGGLIGGVVAAVINGVFNRANSDNMWRSQHLSDDKKEVRSIINTLNQVLTLFNSKEEAMHRYESIQKVRSNKQYAHGDLHTLQQQLNNLLGFIDPNNKYAEELHLKYSIIIKKLEQFLNNNDDDAYKEAIEIKSTIDDLVRNYFVEYYPKQSIWTRFNRWLDLDS